MSDPKEIIEARKFLRYKNRIIGPEHGDGRGRVEVTKIIGPMSFWQTKYKTLRGAFMKWRQIEHRRRKYLQNNLQKLTVWTHEVYGGNQESIWKIKNLLSEMREEAEF